MKMIERRKVGMSGKNQLYVYLPHIKNLKQGDYLDFEQTDNGLLLNKSRKK